MECPHCGSEDVHQVRYMGLRCLVCRSCGYDEREAYDVMPDEAQRPLRDRWKPYRSREKRQDERLR
ncbi:MAG: hypothetical protein ACOCWQ_01680 [Nanoarchaeota archaeon]